MCPAGFKGDLGLMSHSVKVNIVIIFHLLSSGASTMVEKPYVAEVFSLCYLFLVSLASEEFM